MVREAEFYLKLPNHSVRCELCPHFCHLSDGQSGRCRSRTNNGGILIAVNYGRSIGGYQDPIEKKPLYHYHPGSLIYSLGPNSCNLSCDFCQNYQISQLDSPTVPLSPDQLKTLLNSNDLHQVAFTYTEPLTWYEFILDFARLAPETDIVLVSNGYINPGPLQKLLPYLKAMNIDLKSIRETFYKQRCGGDPAPVLQTISMAHAAGVHLELTNLLIPGANDDPADILDLVEFCAELDPELPLHFSAYHPAYRSSEPETPGSSVIAACRLAKSRLRNVYAGNLAESLFSDTVCPACGKTVISRRSGRVLCAPNWGGNCPQCGNKILGVFG